MSKGWKTVKMEVICEMYQPKTISQEEMMSDGEYPVFGANGIIGRYNKYNHEEPQLLVTCRGATCGTINISEPFSWITGNSMVVLPKNKDEISFEYLSLYLRQKNIMSTVITGAAQPQITRSNLKELRISYPRDTTTQFQIAATLGKTSELIALRKKQLEELDALAESVFYDMFGDPVKNEKRWKEGHLGEVCSSVNYGTSSPANEGGKYKYLRMNNITYQGDLDLTNLKYIDISDKNYEKYVVRKGDILFNRTNSKELVGKTTYIQGGEEAIIAGYIIRVRLNSTMLPVFVSKYMNTKFIKLYLRGLCKSIIGQANINAKELQSIPMYFPPLPLQTQFAAIIEKIESQKALAKQALQESEDLFQRLMQDLFKPD
ncbi:MAG: restriction endonuclease subunit S [Dysgonamonadaceae bacterium]|jgi:type I restriction enzyme S subunit|nr:restriction endonuclease subunit S [Dysgonamonadaceae bacterium]